jgi:hypothetical protein
MDRRGGGTRRLVPRVPSRLQVSDRGESRSGIAAANSRSVDRKSGGRTFDGDRPMKRDRHDARDDQRFGPCSPRDLPALAPSEPLRPDDRLGHAPLPHSKSLSERPPTENVPDLGGVRCDTVRNPRDEEDHPSVRSRLDCIQSLEFTSPHRIDRRDLPVYLRILTG